MSEHQRRLNPGLVGEERPHNSVGVDLVVQNRQRNTLSGGGLDRSDRVDVVRRQVRAESVYGVDVGEILSSGKRAPEAVAAARRSTEVNRGNPYRERAMGGIGGLNGTRYCGRHRERPLNAAGANPCKQMWLRAVTVHHPVRRVGAVDHCYLVCP